VPNIPTVRTEPDEFLNPYAAQGLIITQAEPLRVLLLWPTGTASEHEGVQAQQFGELFGIWDEDGNLPEGLEEAMAVRAERAAAMQLEAQRQQAQHDLLNGIRNSMPPPGSGPHPLP
jgi:hypothetical protein